MNATIPGNVDVHPTAKLPILWLSLCYFTCISAIVISTYLIFKQFINYRKPTEQRLVIRIQLLVPLFSISCLLAIERPHLTQIYLDPLREFYEAFVIYTFFSLLTFILGGERNIITELSADHRPTKHVLSILGEVDLSDPSDFLKVKRGVLQYVWFKPFYCLLLLTCEVFHLNKFQFWLLIFYNISVTWSLYSLALFWRCLHTELQPYNPWAKFLCVKLIIFASYWQGIFIQSLNFLGNFGTGEIAAKKSYIYQNGILCIEMIGFALLHSHAFPWEPYSVQEIPNGARMTFWFALRDCFGAADLKWDFKQTLVVGETYYNYRNFDSSVDNLLKSKSNIRSTINKLNQGYRFSNTGENKYWVNYGSTSTSNNSNRNPSKSHIKNESVSDDKWNTSLCDNQSYIPTDPNYPVLWNSSGYRFTDNVKRLKKTIESRSSTV